MPEKYETSTLGMANHVFGDKNMATLKVNLNKALTSNDVSFITVWGASEFITIYSLEQWQQLDYIVRKCFDDYS